MTVTALAYGRSMGKAENPWRTLRGRPHLVLYFSWLRDTKGLIVDHGAFREIFLDHRLDRVERRCVLMHELVHDERGIFYNDRLPRELIDKEEHAVNAEVARRLVPLDDLAEYVDLAVVCGEGVTVSMVAEEYDVTDDVARAAMEQLLRESRMAG